MKFMIITQEANLDNLSNGLNYSPFSYDIIEGVGVAGALKIVVERYALDISMDKTFYQREMAFIEKWGVTTLKQRKNKRRLTITVARMNDEEQHE